MSLTHLSLFSGIGGLDLAAEWAGFETVGQCEWADYPTKVLEKHWPDVPRWRDIRTLTGESFYEQTGLRTVDVISGGFPCQPFSVAGKQRGKEDDRFLWPEMVRVIKELRPAWVVGENVAGIIRLALDDVLFDLEAQGYATRTFLIPAHAVGAPHQRYRTAIVAHAQSNTEGRLPCRADAEKPRFMFGSQDVADTDSIGFNRTAARESDYDQKRDNTASEQSRGTEFYAAVTGGEVISNTHGSGCKKQYTSSVSEEKRFCSGRSDARAVCNAAGEGLQDGTSEQVGGFKPEPKPQRSDWWAVEPPVGRVAHGVPSRVNRLKCLGNAVVPQQFYPVFKAIATVEEQIMEI